MISNPIHFTTHTPSKTANHGNLQKHCVFRCGEAWYALPAIEVQEVIVAPPITAIPLSGDHLLGICERKNGFLPVLSINQIIHKAHSETPTDTDHLLILDGEPSWAISINDAAYLATIESVLPNESRTNPASCASLLGTAIVDGQVVNVLATGSVYKNAQLGIEAYWNKIGTASNDRLHHQKGIQN